MASKIADALVIGAGIIGASIAWRLAQKGLQVVLVDAGRFAGEASSAGAGMLAPGGEVRERSAFSDLLLEGFARYPAFVGELCRESRMAIDFVRCGAWEYALDAQEFSGLRQLAADQVTLGISSRVDERAMRVIYPDDAIVDPVQVMDALRAACVKVGVGIVEGMRVERVELSGGGVRAGSMRARTAVISAGAWSSGIAMSDGSPLPAAFPVKGHLIGYELPPGTVGPIRRQGHTYILQRSNGFTIAGSTAEQAGFDKSVSAAICAEIRGRAERLYPLLKQFEPVRAWTGLRPGSNEEPVMKRCGDRPVWLAYGHYRNGILAAPAAAEHVAGEITASLEKG